MKMKTLSLKSRWFALVVLAAFVATWFAPVTRVEATPSRTMFTSVLSNGGGNHPQVNWNSGGQ